MRPYFGLLAVIVAGLCPALAAGQPADSDSRMDQFEKRLSELEAKHQADLKARDQEIAELKKELADQKKAPSDEIEKTREDVLKDIESRDSGPITLSNPASFLPDIAVIVDTVGSYSPDRENDAYNRFDVREAHLDVRAEINSRADGVLIIAFERDVENPIFPDDEGGEEEGGPESSANIEEAYAFFHDFGVPNLTAKLGRFHVRFGRQNMLHLHDLPTTDPSFVSQAFLSPEALTDSGLSLSYVLPPDRIGGQYVELIGEILAGEGADSESPVFTGDLSVDSPAINTHILWNTDLNDELNLELGGSWMTGHRDPDNALDANLFGADLTLLRRDPTGGFHNFMLQSEAIYGLIDTEDDGRQESFGLYVLGQQQLNRDWHAGLRLDWTQNPDDQKQEAWGITPYMSWYWSEFLRFRFSYQHRDGDRPAEDSIWLQCTFMFGSHPKHDHPGGHSPAGVHDPAGEHEHDH